MRTVDLETVPIDFLRGLKEEKSEDEYKLSKLQHRKVRTEYWEEFRRLEETFSKSKSIERLSVNVNVKNSQEGNLQCCLELMHGNDINW